MSSIVTYLALQVVVEAADQVGLRHCRDLGTGVVDFYNGVHLEQTRERRHLGKGNPSRMDNRDDIESNQHGTRFG